MHVDHVELADNPPFLGDPVQRDRLHQFETFEKVPYFNAEDAPILEAESNCLEKEAGLTVQRFVASWQSSGLMNWFARGHGYSNNLNNSSEARSPQPNASYISRFLQKKYEHDTPAILNGKGHMTATSDSIGMGYRLRKITGRQRDDERLTFNGVEYATLDEKRVAEFQAFLDQTGADPQPRRRLNLRGSLGETILHRVCLHNHWKLMDRIIQEAPHLINALFEGPEYYGQHALHLVVANGTLKELKKLVEAGADVHYARASGTAFEKGTVGYYDTDNASLLQHTKGAAVSAWSPSPKIRLGGTWKVLVEHKADKSIWNSECYSPLHMAIVNAQWNIVHAMIEDSATQMWKWGNRTGRLYPLADIDTYIDPDTMIQLQLRARRPYPSEGDTQVVLLPPKALEWAIWSDADLIAYHPVFYHVLLQKWELFGRWFFLAQLSFASFYAIVVSVVVYLLPISTNADDQNEPINRQIYFTQADHHPIETARFVFEIFLLLYSAYYLIDNVVFAVFLGKAAWLARTDWKALWRSSRRLWLRRYAAALGRKYGSDEVENVFLGLLAILRDHLSIRRVCWANLLRFSKGTPRLGTLLLILYDLLFSDLMRFFVIYLALLVGFSQALYLQLKGAANVEFASAHNDTMLKSGNYTINEDLLEWHGIDTSFLMMMRWLMTQYDLADLKQASTAGFARALWVIFSILVVILLLNVLIAMLNKTYTKIENNAHRRWIVQWATMVVQLDARLTNGMREKLRAGFTRVRYENEERKRRQEEEEEEKRMREQKGRPNQEEERRRQEEEGGHQRGQEQGRSRVNSVTQHPAVTEVSTTEAPAGGHAHPTEVAAAPTPATPHTAQQGRRAMQQERSSSYQSLPGLGRTQKGQSAQDDLDKREELASSLRRYPNRYFLCEYELIYGPDADSSGNTVVREELVAIQTKENKRRDTPDDPFRKHDRDGSH
ncbi:hypothetical protein HDV00_000901 [Rhizophlyctis rosea]|nr:hypothetical protein HDV00_000901 [Rhizophlyctis rosea]